MRKKKIVIRVNCETFKVRQKSKNKKILFVFAASIGKVFYSDSAEDIEFSYCVLYFDKLKVSPKFDSKIF